ncbi:MAG: valine--tRNA ligase [Clostridiaceae bacterium]|nr:valine--tRNA ligase [Clostridiaceae bacterium]
MARIDNIPKSFEPRETESKLYAEWQDKGYFQPPADDGRPTFTIVIPPPNITGQLHMGHALDNALQDLLIRFKRMQGYAALWIPGTDHASIATEAKIVEAMRKEGLTKEDIGREAFLERAWAWKKLYGSRIIEQLKRLGSSCDWSRERFTMDEGLSEAVQHVFITLYEKGLIYRGERIINWCPHCRTSISDAEVNYEEQDSQFWHLRYPLADGSGDLILATTRPETLLGDTAVAVHPDDERYRHLVGKQVILPLVGRTIPVIADSYVEKDFGTGVVKITPAHDPNDFEVGLRHKLPVINILTEDAHINEAGGLYAGLDRMEARKKIVIDLETGGWLIKTEPHKHNVGTCYRCHTVVEPRVSFQWFVRMKPLAEPAIAVVQEHKTRIVPERFEKTYFNWMENIRDWCISRQLWWGHRIPAWYCDDCGHITVSGSTPEHCESCGGSRLRQDEDTLDTWFSSALWPFSTLGWPKDTEDFRRFYPTSVLVTGYDIIFFWVARMIFSGLEHTGKTPFHTVLMHGIVRDSEGRKMSKSLGNGIDPLEIIDQYGADALRYALVNGNAPGNDQRFQKDKIEAGRNFINKIWNAFRFTVMNFDDEMDFSAVMPQDLNLEDRWILSRLQTLKAEVTANLEKYEFGVALAKITSFLWEEFCDWSIEMSKPRLSSGADKAGRLTAQYVLNRVLTESMQLLHPFMPFVSETVYQQLIHPAGSIMMSRWPEPDPQLMFPQEEQAMASLMEAIRGIRNVRTQMNVAPARKIHMIVVSPDMAVCGRFRDGLPYLQRLAGISDLKTQADKTGIPLTAVASLFTGGEIYMPLADLIDLDQEIKRLQQETDNLERELARVAGKLGNSEFTGKAPEKVVQAERDKQLRFQDMRQSALERLALLQQEQKNQGN